MHWRFAHVGSDLRVRPADRGGPNSLPTNRDDLVGAPSVEMKVSSSCVPNPSNHRRPLSTVRFRSLDNRLRLRRRVVKMATRRDMDQQIVSIDAILRDSSVAFRRKSVVNFSVGCRSCRLALPPIENEKLVRHYVPFRRARRW